ncbi:MAG TPA: alpha/beta hydrolase [Candidatus Limnocylindrales bacterium]|nr:alpha/beta hydrolase [Candidatus Limnocylindrales bacterium]
MDVISGRPEPEGFLVEIVPGERIHFLDWGPPGGTGPQGEADQPPGVLLVHGLGSTAWTWAPVARRLRDRVRVVAIDLRGHGLSDAPTSGYTTDQLAEDVVAVAEGSGLLTDGGPRVVLAGHGFGAIVATWAAAALGDRCAGLVLVDGGWQDLAEETGMSPDEWLREMEEPPGVFSSMAAYLADRREFDPASWDADQDRAARSTVVEVPAGKVVSATRPHAVAASVEAMFTYDPLEALAAVPAPVAILLAAHEDPAGRADRLTALDQVRVRTGLAPIRRIDLSSAGHNLMRYRPAEVTAAILAVSGEPTRT